jgi:peptidoglycan/xylan/chitin deacetylase (PgdA/CDA1 family)
VDARAVTTARELERARPLRFRARSRLRRAALAGLTRVPHERPPGVRIVHYHFVFDDELSSFERQLEWFRSEFEPVSLTEAAIRLERGDVRGRELVVTFDDGFRNQALNAAPLLREAGISACFFLITGLLGATPDDVRAFCTERLHLPRPVEAMGWDDALRLLELGHEVGSHTRTHPNLARTDGDALEGELLGSREELEGRLGRPVRHLSAPYGNAQSFAPSVAHAARESGYASCASALRGINASGADVFALRRDHLSASWPLRDVRYFLTR